VLVYEDVVAATLSAIGDPAVSRRMRITVTPPELNMEMDSYRVGTLLELVREMALGLYREGKRVRVCVQGSMGTGVFTSLPRALGGVAKVLRMMDWQAEPGEVNDGALGTVQRDLAEGEEAVEGPIRFGAVGADEVRADDDVLLLIAPQNMVGVSLFDALGGMAEAAAHRPMVIINPLLDDRPSSGGLMSVRGRAERTKFYESFEQIYTFRLLYSGTDFMFPIRGAIRMSRASGGLYVVYQRLEGDDGERYEPVGVFESPPCAESLTRLVRRPDDLR
jgi:adenylate kinase